MFLPAISFPRAKGTFVSIDLYSFDSIKLLKKTLVLDLLGTSIPIADLPGIGASIRISEVASANAISLVKLVILLTLIPGAGCISYLVIVGPLLICNILQGILKLFRVSISF